MARATTSKTTTKSSTRKTTTRKPAAKAATKPATKKATATKAAAKPAVAKGVTAPTPEVTRELKKKELIELVVARTELKRPQARAAVEAALEILGASVAKGEALNLEPFGKLKVAKEKDIGQARVFTCRVRQRKAGKAPAAPLAEAAE